MFSSNHQHPYLKDLVLKFMMHAFLKVNIKIIIVNNFIIDYVENFILYFDYFM
jgi:hypothetical protein